MKITIPNPVTIPELARITGKNATFLARRAADLEFKKFGRDYRLTRKQAIRLLASIRETCGRPRIPQKSSSRK